MLASVGHCRGASEWVGDRLQEGLGKPDTFSHLPLLSVGLLSGRETLTVMVSLCILRTLGQVRERLRYGGREVSHPHPTDEHCSLRHATVALKECA